LKYRKNPNRNLNVPELLQRLGIKATRLGPTRWVAFCPNPEHQNTKTPAWFIRDDQSSPYHATHCCKSCGFEGGTLSLIEGVLGLDRDQAREWLEENKGPVTHPLKVEIEVKESLSQTGFQPEGVEEIDFLSDSSPTRFDIGALCYLKQSRNVTEVQIQEFQIGCVHPKAKHGPKRHRLRGRIVIPVLNKRGQWEAYTARDYTGKSEYKYLEPKREENPSYTAILGEHLWTDQKTCVVCEGPFDVLALHRSLPPTIAIAGLRGSDPNPTKLSKLLQFERLIIATDNDPAGNKAAKEIRYLLGAYREIVRACPPPGVDLADMDETVRRSFLSGIIGFSDH
jgi:hypothetical protein